MPVYIDQTGRKITIAAHPQRIISLVPSQTELLSDLGLEKEVAGITKFCVHPEQWFKNKIRVGGTRKIKMEQIEQLHPDLIIANKEENVKEQIEELGKKYPVWVSDIRHLDDAVHMINQIGIITNKEQEAGILADRINQKFIQFPIRKSSFRTIYLIWQHPYITVGGDTFISSMMGIAGFKNLFVHANRYPEITIESLQRKDPDLLLLSSEPFPFRQKHMDELQIHLPGVKILLVNGEMFSWYGSRLLLAPAYFMDLHKKIK